MRVVTYGISKGLQGEVRLALRHQRHDADVWAAAMESDLRAALLDRAAEAVILGVVDGPQTAQLVQRLREGPHVPLIVIGSFMGESSQEAIQMLEAGADDYVDRYANVTELLARLSALLRRPHLTNGRG